MKNLRQLSERKRYEIENAKYEGKTPLLRKAVNMACSLPFWKPLFRGTCESIDVNNVEFSFPHLPDVFSGFGILYVSDLHLEIAPNPLENFLSMTLPEHDIVVVGGDIFDNYFEREMDKLDLFLSKFEKPVYVVLGNHDKLDLIKYLEDKNVRVLLNESVFIERDNQKFIMTGIDDVTYYKSELQKASCEDTAELFDGVKVMLSHNPDFLEVAAEAGYDLQLSGHTHGGQFKVFDYIVFPQTKFDFAIKGKWLVSGRNLQGFTSTGFGSSGYPIRNIRPEVAIIKLRKG